MYGVTCIDLAYPCGFVGETIAIADYYVSFGTNRRYPKLRADVVGVQRVVRGSPNFIKFDNLDLIPRGPKYYATVVGEAGNRRRATTVSDGEWHTYIDLIRAPYVLYGVKFIDPVSLDTISGIAVGYGDPIIGGDIEAPPYQSDLNRLAVGFASFRSSTAIIYYEIAVGSKPLTPTSARDQTFEFMNFTCVCIEGEYLCPVKDGENKTCVDATYSGSGKMIYEDINGVQYKWVEGAILTGVQGLDLTPGADYYLNIRATDRAYGALSVQSSRIRLDITPPIPGTVVVGGPGVDLQAIDRTKVMFVSHFNQIVVSWNGYDPESGVEAYDVAIVERDDCNTSQVPDASLYATVSNITEMLVESVKLTKGKAYVAFVKTTNRVGMVTLAASLPFYLDDSLPTLGQVRSGSNFYVARESLYQSQTDWIGASWLQILDPKRLECIVLDFNFTMPRQLHLTVDDVRGSGTTFKLLNRKTNGMRLEATGNVHATSETVFDSSLLKNTLAGLTMPVVRDFRETRLRSTGLYTKAYISDGSQYAFDVQAAPEPGQVWSAVISQGGIDTVEEIKSSKLATNATFVDLAVGFVKAVPTCAASHFATKEHTLTCSDATSAMAVSCEYGDETLLIMCAKTCPGPATGLFDLTHYREGNRTFAPNRDDNATVTKTADGTTEVRHADGVMYVRDSSGDITVTGAGMVDTAGLLTLSSK